MFDFLRRSKVRRPSLAIRDALKKAGLPQSVDLSRLSVVETHGQQAGRSVTYFKVFDPNVAEARGIDIKAEQDLEAHPDLVLFAGLVERDNTVVLTKRASAVTAPTPDRVRALSLIHI